MIRIIFSFFIFAICFQSSAFAQFDYEVLNQKSKICNWDVECHYGLFKEYKEDPLARYYYAVALKNDKDYYKAKENLEILLSYSNLNKVFMDAVQIQYDEISQKLKDIHVANSNDYGNYVSDLAGNYYTWKNPSKIKVFIKGEAKKAILKQAFDKWDYELYQLVNFEYVFNESQADIVCYCVEKLDEKKAGLAHVKHVGKKIVSAIVEVTTKDILNNSYNDKEILSIALHEIGHALGIMGHSKNLNDIMYFSMESYKNGTISRKDINTIFRIYSLNN